MNYEVVTLEARTVVGIGTRTSNDAPDMAQKIGQVWQEFMGKGAVDRVPGKTGESCYGLYYNYTWDDNGYDMLAAWESQGDAPLPEGFQRVTIPAGQYAKFTFHGDARLDTGRFWGEVWDVQLPRAFRVDFEEYVCEDGDEANAEIHIYLGLADICQSCGMPMAKETDYGTQADGSPSKEYCVYCMEKGAFKADCTMEEMIDFCLDNSPEQFTDREKSKQMMQEFFPTLARWRQ